MASTYNYLGIEKMATGENAGTGEIAQIPAAEARGEIRARHILVETREEADEVARLLAEAGYRVIVPVLINRSDQWSGHLRIRYTNQPHREFIYRMAFEMGRHIIGYEVQKVLAAVDGFKRQWPDLKAALGEKVM